MAKGTLYVGTSGYSYKEWKGAFYPEKLPVSRFLEFYAGKLSTVEINNTFYRFPATKLLEGWRAATPEGFRFAVKANQGITHKGRLKGVDQLAIDFLERCQVLGDKLGPVLFQLPPNLKRDDERLAEFLGLLGSEVRCAFEFRHESWFDEAVFERLSEAGAALCISEGEKLDTPRVATARFCYLRLRKDGYSDDELHDWRRWISGQLTAGRDVFAYLKHDQEGVSPAHALRLLEDG